MLHVVLNYVLDAHSTIYAQSHPALIVSNNVMNIAIHMNYSDIFAIISVDLVFPR